MTGRVPVARVTPPGRVLTSSRGSASPQPGVAALLALQQGAGNRAVACRVLARRTTGMREAAPTSAYVKAAADHWKDPARKRESVDAFARFLADRAVATLAGLGIPAPKPDVDTSLAVPGQLDPKGWALTLNTALWVPSSKARTLGGMTADEVAAAVGLVYHEARHAEQHFRMARVQAGEQVKAKIKDVAAALETGMQLRPEVARAAAAAPLPDTAANADLVAEARDWHAITRGRHLAYKNVVIPWDLEARKAKELFAKVEPMRLEPIRDGLAPVVRGWAAGATRAKLLVTHKARIDKLPAKTAGDREILTQIAAIKVASDAVTATFKALDAGWKTDKPSERLARVYEMKDRIQALIVALDSAYTAEPHERDAFDAEAPVIKEFRAAIGAP